MKAIILVLLMCPVAFAAEEPFAVSTKVTEYPARDGKTAKTIRVQTFRGKEKIRDRSEKDTDGDGVTDWFFDSFWVDGEAVYSTSRSKSLGTSSSFSSHADICVVLTDSKTTGQLEQIAFFTGKGGLREMFVRNAKGEFEPLSKEEFAKAVQHTKELSPFMEGVLDTIRDTKPKEAPNKSVEPTPTR